MRGFVSRFPAGLTYARVASSSDLFFGFDFRNKVVVLYDPVDDKLLWEHSGYINSPFLNQHGKTILIDQSGKGFLIDGRGQRSSAFEVKLGDNGINTALARDGKKACFLSENEIMMFDVDNGQILWRKENTTGSKRILRFDSGGIIMSDSFIIPSIGGLRAISEVGGDLWNLDFTKNERPPFDSLLRFGDLLVFISNGMGSITAFKIVQLM